MAAAEVALFDPGHQAAQVFAGFLDGVSGFFLADAVEVGLAGVVLGGPFAGEVAVLNGLELLAHGVLDVFGDDFRADGDVAVLSGFGDGEAHAGDAGFEHEVDDELQFVQALEVSHFGLITGFDEDFEACLDEGGSAAAEDALFAEEVGFGFFFEVGLEHTAAGAADAFGPSERNFFGVARSVIVDGDESGDAFAFEVLAADQVAGAFGGDHDDVHVCGSRDGLEVNGEAVGEKEGLSWGEVRGDIGLIHFGDDGVRDSDHDDVGFFDGFGGVEHFEAAFGSGGAAFGAGVEADDDLDAAFFEVEGVSVALGAEADHGANFTFQRCCAGFTICNHFGCHGDVCIFG